MEGKDEHSPVQTTSGTKSYIMSICELIFSFEQKQKECNLVSMLNMDWKYNLVLNKHVEPLEQTEFITG